MPLKKQSKSSALSPRDIPKCIHRTCPARHTSTLLVNSGPGALSRRAALLGRGASRPPRSTGGAGRLRWSTGAWPGHSVESAGQVGVADSDEVGHIPAQEESVDDASDRPQR